MASTGNRIQSRREELGLSREQLAQRLDIPKLKVWRVETGKVKIDADSLPAWASALETIASALLPDAIPPTPAEPADETPESAA